MRESERTAVESLTHASRAPKPATLTEQVLLVDSFDKVVGASEKIAAHRGAGLLHRAFSIFLVNGDGRLLLQRRSSKKYHFRGLWSNACCGHPRPGEPVAQAAARRLYEETGAVTELAPLFSFIYSASDRHSGYTEREYDHVLLGCYDGDLHPCPEEIDELRWMTPIELTADTQLNTHLYTPWFLLALPRVLAMAGDRAGAPGPAPRCSWDP